MPSPTTTVPSSILAGAQACWHGEVAWSEAVALNLAAAIKVAEGATPVVHFFTPLAPVYALGRRAQPPAARAALRGTLETCAARGIAIVDVDRGGLGTLHGPGQLVAFLAVPCVATQTRTLCAELLSGIVRLAKQRQVSARCDLGDDVGVWGEDGKLASLGLRIKNGVAQHGVALNVHVRGELSGGLTLCGSAHTRLQNLVPADTAGVQLHEVARDLARQWSLEFRDRPQ